MNTVETLLKEVQDFPEPLVEQVLIFTRALRTRSLSPRMETALASEEVLARDWLTPEEDAAWTDL